MNLLLFLIELRPSISSAVQCNDDNNMNNISQLSLFVH